jgi:hypothetical protein
MIESVEATGPRKSAWEINPTHEFVVPSVRLQTFGDVPDLVLRRRPIEKAGQPVREDVTVIILEISSPPEANMSDGVTAPAPKPAADRVAEYVASLSVNTTETVERVVDSIIAAEERGHAASEPSGPFGSDGSPFADSTLPTPPSPNRYTKRVEFDRS